MTFPLPREPGWPCRSSKQVVLEFKTARDDPHHGFISYVVWRCWVFYTGYEGKRICQSVPSHSGVFFLCASVKVLGGRFLCDVVPHAIAPRVLWRCKEMNEGPENVRSLIGLEIDCGECNASPRPRFCFDFAGCTGSMADRHERKRPPRGSIVRRISHSRFRLALHGAGITAGPYTIWQVSFANE